MTILNPPYIIAFFLTSAALMRSVGDSPDFYLGGSIRDNGKVDWYFVSIFLSPLYQILE
jgi:hypothetical protein